MLDLYKLHIFTLVAQQGSFSGAAARLLMTQSGVSQHMQELEHQLGVQLFQRGRRGVTLTASGEKLHGYAQTLLRLAAEAENAVADVGNLAAGQVTIGATPGISVYLLPDWASGFRTRFPHLTVSLQTGVTENILGLLHTRRIDLGFVEGELDDGAAAQVSVAVLEEVEQQVAVGRQHPLWGRQSVSLGELSEYTFILRQPKSQSRVWVDGVLSAHGLRPRIVAEFDNLESIKRSVINGTCLTIVPGYVVQQEREMGLIHLLPVDDVPLLRTLKLVWEKGRPFSPIVVTFLKHIRTLFPRLTWP